MPGDWDWERLGRVQARRARNPLLRWLDKHDPDRTGTALAFFGFLVGFLGMVVFTLARVMLWWMAG